MDAMTHLRLIAPGLTSLTTKLKMKMAMMSLMKQMLNFKCQFPRLKLIDMMITSTMNKYCFKLFDADVGATLYVEDYDTALKSLDAAASVIDCYSFEESFADKREAEENKMWNPETVKNKFTAAVLSPFFDSISIWLPGHHRKLTITKIEEKKEEVS